MHLGVLTAFVRNCICMVACLVGVLPLGAVVGRPLEQKTNIILNQKDGLLNGDKNRLISQRKTRFLEEGSQTRVVY